MVKCGIGDAALNGNGVGVVMNDLALITGQKPVVMRSTKAIAKYKSREKQPFGVSCSLRGNVSYIINPFELLHFSRKFLHLFLSHESFCFVRH